MKKKKGKKKGKEHKTPTTSVNLTPAAYVIKEKLTQEWDLKKVLSASVLLFDEQNHLVQKRLIIESMGGTPTTIVELEAVFRAQVLQVVQESKAPPQTKRVSRKAKSATSR